MSYVLEMLRPMRPEDEIWRAAQEAIKKTGAKELLLGLACKLWEQGDDSAIVLESRKGNDYFPYNAGLMLRWDLRPPRVSKGVKIVVSHFGNVREVGLTYNNEDWKRWISLEGLSALHLETLPQKLEEMPLEEQVRVAMSIAGHNVDYRGEKEKSLVRRLVEGKGWERIFP